MIATNQLWLSPSTATVVRVHRDLPARTDLDRWAQYTAEFGALPLSRHPVWLTVLHRGLGHMPFCLEAMAGGQTRGLLPLAYLRSLLFGRFLVGLPYVNYGGVLADSPEVARQLVSRAVRLADELDVRYLELRGEPADLVEHAALVPQMGNKVHMRLPLPGHADELWRRLDAKVRNQVRKGEKSGLTIAWGAGERLADFYAVFSHNMRNLGTPVYPRRFFQAILQQFPGQAELCVTHLGRRPVAAALLLHGRGVTEVPSASSLRAYNSTNANMIMYWHLLCRAVQQGQSLFDFGRSSPASNTFRFKKQWGAVPSLAAWQYYLRHGHPGEMRPETPRYRHFIRLWQRLPVFLTRLIGPSLVRGIP